MEESLNTQLENITQNSDKLKQTVTKLETKDLKNSVLEPHTPLKIEISPPKCIENDECGRLEKLLISQQLDSNLQQEQSIESSIAKILQERATRRRRRVVIQHTGSPISPITSPIASPRNSFIKTIKYNDELFQAVAEGRYDFVKNILEKEPKRIEKRIHEKLSLLHIAASENQIEIMKLLLEKGSKTFEKTKIEYKKKNLK